MSNSFDFNSKKYMLLLIIICIVFSIFIIKAFDYLPDTEVVDTNDTEIENINTTSSAESPLNDNTNINMYKPIQKKGVLYRSKDSLSNDEMDFEEVDAPSGVAEDNYTDNISDNSVQKLSPDELAIKSIMQARRYSNTNNLSSSLNEYKNAIDIANDPEVKAEAFDGISLLYAKNNKFETALSFANKAYQTSPSAARGFMIAKIYYSAGKSDLAISKINEVLKQDYRY